VEGGTGNSLPVLRSNKVVGHAHPGTIIARWNASATIAIAIGIEIDSDLDFAHLANKKMFKLQVLHSNKSPKGYPPNPLKVDPCPLCDYPVGFDYYIFI